MPGSIHVTVAAIIERGNRYLLVEEKIDGSLLLNQPAGHLETGESLVDAVFRETLEETGHDFEPDSVLGVYRWQSDNQDTLIRFAFTGVAEAVPDRILDPAIKRIAWLDLEQVTAARLRLRSPLVLTVINDHRRGLRYSLDCLKDVVSATL